MPKLLYIIIRKNEEKKVAIPELELELAHRSVIPEELSGQHLQKLKIHPSSRNKNDR